MPIKRLVGTGLCCVLGSVLCDASLAQLDEDEVDTFFIDIGMDRISDSNFDRTPDGDSESYTNAEFGLGIARSSSRHIFNLAGSYHFNEYDSRKDLNASFPQARAQWKSLWTPKIRTEFQWEKEGYQVSQDEFQDKDIVDRDDAQASLHFGDSSGLVLGLGGMLTLQRHSNEQRSPYEFDEKGAFAELALVTHAGSRILLRQLAGKRDYLEAFVDDTEVQDLDYDFTNMEFEWSLKGQRETELGLIAGFSEREGEINEGDGPYLHLRATYSLGELTQVYANLISREPVVGERTDAPTDEKLFNIGLKWQARPTLTLSSSAQLLDQEYGRETVNEEINSLVRDEKRYHIEILNIQYQPEDFVTLYGSFMKEKRESPLDYRFYETDIARLGLTFIF